MRYEAPTSTKDAVGLLSKAKGKGQVLAGGSDLLVRLKGGFIEPDLIVDIKRIPAMQGVTKTASGFKIGAAVSCAQLGENAALKKAWPGVVEAANLIGSDQIQSRCTVVGNLCNASPAADSVPAMVAAKAKAVVVGPKGKRTIPVENVVAGPGKTALKAGELIESITLPARKGKTGDAYLRFIPRTEMDIAVCSAGVNLTLGRGGVVTDARVALGAVAPTVVLVPAAAKAIIGTKLDDVALAALAAACEAACNPIDDKRGTVEFRTEVAGVLAKRAAKIAYQRAGG
ncbi:MAG: xanthine dehydrogenase family protein subunit M [Gammaproteobacteria bacterium]|nr:xanthine dehydrogenase family protein subunit M [Gammaproteobacteria bacterium]